MGCSAAAAGQQVPRPTLAQLRRGQRGQLCGGPNPNPNPNSNPNPNPNPNPKPHPNPNKVAASRLRSPSDPPVRLVSKVGDDINGSALLAELEADGVDTSWCARAGHGHATPTSFILVSAVTTLTLTLTLSLTLILTLTLALTLTLTLTLALTLTLTLTLTKVNGESRTIIHDPGFVEGEGLG